MSTDYFRNFALGDELERNTLLPGVKGAAKEFADVFDYNAKQLPKKKAAEFVNKVYKYVTSEGVIQGALNEGVEEVMEEAVSDAVKGVSLALNHLGLVDANKTYDFGFSAKDILSRYGTAFFGGAIGGAVFSTHDLVERRLSGKTNDITPSGISDLVFYLRSGEGDKLRKIAKDLHDAGKLGSTTLSTEILRIEKDGDLEKIIYAPAKNDDNSQNTAVYKYLLERFNTIEELLKKENLLVSDNYLNALVQNPDFDFDNLSQEELKNTAYQHAEENMAAALQGGLATRVVHDFQEIAQNIVATELQIRRLLTPAVDESSDNKAIETKIAAVKEGAEYKELSEKLKNLRQQRDDILTGKQTPYYVEQGLFVGSIDFAHMFKLPINVKNYTKIKYDRNYDELSDSKKQEIDAEYKLFMDKNGKESAYYSFEIFRKLSEKTKSLIEKQGSRFDTFREFFVKSELFGAQWLNTRNMLLAVKESLEKDLENADDETKTGIQTQLSEILEQLKNLSEDTVLAPVYNVTRSTKNIISLPTKENADTDEQYLNKVYKYLDDVLAYVKGVESANGFVEAGDITIEGLFDALFNLNTTESEVKSQLEAGREYLKQQR